MPCPVLRVWGEQDRHVPPVRADALARALGGARVVSVPAAGHLPQVEQPEAFLQTLST